MPVLRSRVRLDADRRAVAGMLRDTQLTALGRGRHGLQAQRRLLVAGDEVNVRVRLAPGVAVPLLFRVDAVSLGGLASSLVNGPFRHLDHVVSIADEGGVVEVHDEVRWDGPIGQLIAGWVGNVLAARAQALRDRVAALAGLPVVVATALVRDGRVLAAQRTRPAALVGRWELPGGRVEPGESEAAAVVRECREELGAHVVADCRLSTDLPIDAGVLRVHTARLARDSPEPMAIEHSALRWLGPAELDAVGWVDADRAVIEDLRALLTTGGR